LNVPALAHACSFAAAAMLPFELKLVLPPPDPKMKSRAYALLTFWSISSSYSWIPGHLSRFPNWIGVSPARLAFASARSNAWKVVGTFRLSFRSFALL
jgi:hypothetical protein